MFPKISSTNRRRARAIREGDLFSLERISGVFMRGIRAPRENLSEKRWNALSSTRWEFDWASPFPIVFGEADPPCPGSVSGVRRSCETAQLARDAAQLGRAFGRLGRSTALAGIFRHVLEADLLNGAP